MMGHRGRYQRALGILLGLVCLFCAADEPAEPPNILFIAIDDLRPELGCYGASHMVTPHLDRLAAEGRLFERHFVQVPTCGASRYAMLTGNRPSKPAHLSNEALREELPRREGPRPESFVHLFRRNGYRTVALGKVSHYPDGRVYAYDGTGTGEPEMPFSWDERWGPTGKWGTAWNAFFGYADGSNRNQDRGHLPAFERAAVPDTAYPDGLIAEQAILKLRELSGERFFLAVGFFKPHLPFTAPEPYWKLYDPERIELSPNPDPPIGTNPNSLHASGEMFGSYGHPVQGGKGVRIDDGYARTLRHAYFASVSFVDAQVGKVLDELDRLGLRENTVVVVWGDHGWHLGDHTVWGKHTTFERSLRSTLIVRTPGMNAPGMASNALVESVDLYPTLTALAGLDPPEGLPGRSFAPALDDPAWQGEAGAYGYWHGRRTLRTDRYRITLYEGGGEPDVELFDHVTDPLETVNVAGQHPEVVERLSRRLRQD